MSWEEVSTSKTIDIKKEKGKTYEGFYLGSHTIQTSMGEQFIYNFENEDETFGIYGFTNLNNAMSRVKKGLNVRVTYTGLTPEKIKTKFGMKHVHQCKVEINTDGAKIIKDDVPPPDDSDIGF